MHTIKKIKVLLSLVIILFISCNKSNKNKDSGSLNLNVSFNVKYYPCVLDTVCGCLNKTSDLWAYWEPNILIKDSNGNVVFKKEARQINIYNLPLQAGKYSIRYYMGLWSGVSVCDSMRDIWKWQFAPGYPEYCINKNKYNYKTLDTTEIFIINNNVVIDIHRSF